MFTVFFWKAYREGRLAGYEEKMKRFQRELRSPLYRDADEKHRQQGYEGKSIAPVAIK